MAAMKPRTGDGPLEVTKEGRGYVMRVPLEGGGRLVVEDHDANDDISFAQQINLHRISRSYVERFMRDAGVKVRYVTRGSRLSEHEALLSARLRASAGSSFRQCTASCAAQWRTSQMPSVVLVSRADGTPRSTVGSTRRMRAGMVQRAARAVSTTRSSSLTAAVAAFQYR